MSWLALNLEVLVTVACFRWEAAVITFMSKTPLFGLEKLKVYLIKVLLAKGLGPPSFALLSSIKTTCFRSSRVPGLEMNLDLEWGVCGEKGLMFPRLNSDRIIQTLKKWSVLSQEEQLPKFVDSHVHSFIQQMSTVYWIPSEWLWLPWWLNSKESTCECRGWGFNPWIGKIPCRREWQPTLVFLPGKYPGQRSLASYSPWGCKGVDTTQRLEQQQLNDWPRAGHQGHSSDQMVLGSGLKEAARVGWGRHRTIHIFVIGVKFTIFKCTIQCH